MMLPAIRIIPTSQTSIDCLCFNLEDNELAVQVLHEAILDLSAQLTTVNFHPHDSPLSVTSQEEEKA